MFILIFDSKYYKISLTRLHSTDNRSNRITNNIWRSVVLLTPTFISSKGLKGKIISFSVPFPLANRSSLMELARNRGGEILMETSFTSSWLLVKARDNLAKEGKWVIDGDRQKGKKVGKKKNDRRFLGKKEWRLLPFGEGSRFYLVVGWQTSINSWKKDS